MKIIEDTQYLLLTILDLKIPLFFTR